MLANCRIMLQRTRGWSPKATPMELPPGFCSLGLHLPYSSTHANATMCQGSVSKDFVSVHENHVCLWQTKADQKFHLISTFTSPWNMAGSSKVWRQNLLHLQSAKRQRASGSHCICCSVCSLKIFPKHPKTCLLVQ